MDRAGKQWEHWCMVSCRSQLTPNDMQMGGSWDNGNVSHQLDMSFPHLYLVVEKEHKRETDEGKTHTAQVNDRY